MILSGGSAGGLATYLHADDWHARIPSSSRFVAVPDSGFFLAYNATTGTAYGANMRWLAARMNTTEGGLPAACVAANPQDPLSCIFAEVIARTIKAPIFAQQSTYDSWQVQEILHAQRSDIAAINKYGEMVNARVRADLIAPHADAAVFLDSCLHHVGEWDEIVIDGMLVHEALQAFYESIGHGGKRVWAQGKAYPCAACCTGGQ